LRPSAFNGLLGSSRWRARALQVAPDPREACSVWYPSRAYRSRVRPAGEVPNRGSGAVARRGSRGGRGRARGKSPRARGTRRPDAQASGSGGGDSWIEFGLGKDGGALAERGVGGLARRPTEHPQSNQRSRLEASCQVAPASGSLGAQPLEEDAREEGCSPATRSARTQDRKQSAIFESAQRTAVKQRPHQETRS
jgi:hypothetical protein